MRRNLFIFTGILLLVLPQFLFAQSRTVAVLTPFLAQPGTQLMVEGFEAAAKSKGWQVDVIDTSGDVAALVSRMEDVALQKVDAMVFEKVRGTAYINGEEWASRELTLPAWPD